MTGPIVVAGEALYDLVLEPDEGRTALLPGGGPFNAARAIGRLGQPVSYVGRLSTDRLGRRLRATLAADGVDVSRVVSTEDPTTLAVAELDAGGGAAYRFYERGTSVPGLTAEMAEAALPADASAVHVGTLGLVFEPIASTLAALVARVPDPTWVMLDPNCRPVAIADREAYVRRLRAILRATDVVKLSDEDLAYLSPGESPEAAVGALRAAGPRLVLLTRGAAGVVVVGDGLDVAIPASPVSVVDTIGAGDAFGGAFLAWWRSHGLARADLARPDRVVEAARFAGVVASLTCARAGASPPSARVADGSALTVEALS